MGVDWYKFLCEIYDSFISGYQLDALHECKQCKFTTKPSRIERNGISKDDILVSYHCHHCVDRINKEDILKLEDAKVANTFASESTISKFFQQNLHSFHCAYQMKVLYDSTSVNIEFKRP